MKLKTSIAAVTLVLTVGFVIYLAQPGFMTGKKLQTPEAQAQATHQHGGTVAEKPQPEAPPAETKTEEAPTIEISSEKQQLIGVKTVTVSSQPLKKIIRTVGLIEYDQRQQTAVNTKVEGWIEKLFVNYTGMYVKKGDPLVEIYSPELWATQQEFINVVRWAKRSSQAKNEGKPQTRTSTNFGAMIAQDAETLVNAGHQRLRLWDISDEQITKIAESEKPIRTLTIYSPVSGYVLQKTALQGMKVMAGEKLFDVADLSHVWIIADIYEYELPLLKSGETATIQLSYFPGRQFSSKIDYIYPTLSGDTRTAKARFVIPNPGGQLKPQMFTNVEVQVGLGQKLAVPEDAVIDTGLRQIAYVDKGNGYFEPREVRIGQRAENLVEVTAGLKAGEKVASSANFLIDSEAKLKGVEPLTLRTQARSSVTQQAPASQHKH